MNVKRITTEHDLHTAFDIRKTVFVEEQGCPVSDEFDEFDTLHGDCQHILVYHEQQPVGTARVRIVDHAGKLERICILKPYRKFGLGKVIVDELERIVKEKAFIHVNCTVRHRQQAFMKSSAIRQHQRNLYWMAFRMC